MSSLHAGAYECREVTRYIAVRRALQLDQQIGIAAALAHPLGGLVRIAWHTERGQQGSCFIGREMGERELTEPPLTLPGCHGREEAFRGILGPIGPDQEQWRIPQRIDQVYEPVQG